MSAIEMSLEIIADKYIRELFYQANGFSRQNIYKMKKSKQMNEVIENQIVSKVINFRKNKNKNKVGSRIMYYKLQIKSIGINKFERIVSKNNLCVKVKKKRIVTTQGVYGEDDKNLINGMVLTDINQVIAGDITYYISGNQTFYIFTLKDMYSKRILGLEASDNMLTETALKVLNQAIRKRGKGINGCIHHTDAGSQYKSLIYQKMLSRYKLTPSYANNCLENGMAEQLNGMLKYDYLPPKVKDLKELKRLLRSIKKELNEEHLIKELGYKTPEQFENEIKNIPLNERKHIHLYDFTKKGL